MPGVTDIATERACVLSQDIIKGIGFWPSVYSLAAGYSPIAPYACEADQQRPR